MKLLSGPDLGVARNDDHLVVETENPRIVFSFTQKGSAISLHFACPKDSLRYLRSGLDDFCRWAFHAYPWCRMIFGFINIPSVERMVQKIGFEKLLDIEEGAIYVRLRDDTHYGEVKHELYH